MDPTHHGFLELFWVLEPECRIPTFMWSFGALEAGRGPLAASGGGGHRTSLLCTGPSSSERDGDPAPERPRAKFDTPEDERGT